MHFHMRAIAPLEPHVRVQQLGSYPQNAVAIARVVSVGRPLDICHENDATTGPVLYVKRAVRQTAFVLALLQNI